MSNQQERHFLVGYTYQDGSFQRFANYYLVAEKLTKESEIIKEIEDILGKKFNKGFGRHIDVVRILSVCELTEQDAKNFYNIK